MSSEANERLRRVESILVTQITTPNNQAPYDQLVKKYGVRIDYRPFTEVRELPAKDFRKQKISLDEYTAVIFNSKNAVDHFFKLCEELRYKVPEDLKYFCISETIALYLQKHVVYRKRKVFFGNPDLKPVLLKHRKKEKMLVPCSNIGNNALSAFLTENNFNFQEAEMFQTVSSDLSDLKDVFYDVLVFFSPLSIQALYDNFPDFQQNYTRIAAFGAATASAIRERGLILDIEVPTAEVPSMTMALENYFRAVQMPVLREIKEEPKKEV